MSGGCYWCGRPAVSGQLCEVCDALSARADWDLLGYEQDPSPQAWKTVIARLDSCVKDGAPRSGCWWCHRPVTGAGQPSHPDLPDLAGVSRRVQIGALILDDPSVCVICSALLDLLPGGLFESVWALRVAQDVMNDAR